jgi:hypothetical protein
MNIWLRILLLAGWSVLWWHVWDSVSPLYPPPEQGESGSVLFGWFVSAVLFTMTWALLAGAIMKKRKRRPRKEG